jgi:dTDP-4-dehydrorhamnose 3,5-epimerase
MVLTPTPIPGVQVIALTPLMDERGFFAVGFSRHAFSEHGLEPHIEQVNLSYNAASGTLRGLHYQLAPYAETKVVRCVKGAAFDVVVDLRPASPSYCRWFGITLDAEQRRALYIPEGVAHGFQTLTSDTEVLYTVSAPYTPSHCRGVRWDDPAFGIEWPDHAHRTLHPRDRAYADFDRTSHLRSLQEIPS